MNMLGIGIVGTSSIAHEFAKALVMSKEYQIKSVYSRTLFKAESFGNVYGAELFFDNLEEFLSCKDFDVVYIASPNSLHFSQTMAALHKGKHVIVEKPAFSNMVEWEEAFQLAEEKGLFLFEAARHIHDSNFQIIKNEVAKLEEIDSAILHFGKYSSRYDQVLAGEEPNIFSLRFSGGALMDLGVYLIYAAISWFGEPESGEYFPKKVHTGVDGAGTIILHYPYYDAILHVSKISNLFAQSEVHSGKKTLLMDGVSVISSIELHDDASENVQLAVQPPEHLMLDEARAFAEVINHPESKENQEKYQSWKKLSHDVSYWIEKLRKQAGIFFDADTEK